MRSQAAADSQRKVLDSLGPEDPPEVRSLRFEQRRSSTHLHRLFDSADLELHVHAPNRVDLHGDVGGFGFAEAGLLRRDRDRAADGVPVLSKAGRRQNSVSRR